MADKTILHSRNFKKDRQEHLNQSSPFSFPIQQQQPIQVKGFFESFFEKLRRSANQILVASSNYLKNDILHLKSQKPQALVPDKNNLKITIIPSIGAQKLFPNLKLNPNVKCQQQSIQRKRNILPMPIGIQIQSSNECKQTQTQLSQWKKLNNEEYNINLLKEFRQKCDQETQTNENDNLDYQESLENLSKLSKKEDQSNIRATHPRKKKIKMGNLIAVSAENNQNSYLKFIEPQVLSSQNRIKLGQFNQTQSQTSQVYERGKKKKHSRKSKYEVQLDIKESENEDKQSQEKKIQRNEQKDQEENKETKNESNLKNSELDNEKTVTTKINTKFEEKEQEKELQENQYKNQQENHQEIQKENHQEIQKEIQKEEKQQETNIFQQQFQLQIEKPIGQVINQKLEPSKGLFFNQTVDSNLLKKQDNDAIQQKEEKKDDQVKEIKLFRNIQPVVKQQELSIIKEEGEEIKEESNTPNKQIKSGLFQFVQKNNNQEEKQKIAEEDKQKIESINNNKPSTGLFNFNPSTAVNNNSLTNSSSNQQAKGGIFASLIKSSDSSSNNLAKQQKPEEKQKVLNFSDLTKQQNSQQSFNSPQVETSSLKQTESNENKQSSTEIDMEGNPFAGAIKPINQNQNQQPPINYSAAPPANLLFGNFFKNQTMQTGNLFNNQSPMSSQSTQQPQQSSLFANSLQSVQPQQQQFQSPPQFSNNFGNGLFSVTNSQMQQQAMTLFQSSPEQSGNNVQPSLFDNNSGKNSAQGKDSVNKRQRNNKLRVMDQQ